MKKYLSGFIALILAISASAFTAPKGAASDPVYDWRVYDASGNPTSVFVEDKTEAEMRAANPSCNGSNLICFQNYNQAHTQPLGLLIKKP